MSQVRYSSRIPRKRTKGSANHTHLSIRVYSLVPILSYVASGHSLQSSTNELKKNYHEYLNLPNAYSPQKGRFETRTHEAINKPTTERHPDLSANCNIQSTRIYQAYIVTICTQIMLRCMRSQYLTIYTYTLY